MQIASSLVFATTALESATIKKSREKLLIAQTNAINTKQRKGGYVVNKNDEIFEAFEKNYRYILVRACSLMELSEKLEACFERGYPLYGSPFIVSDTYTRVYYQAVCKD